MQDCWTTGGANLPDAFRASRTYRPGVHQDDEWNVEKSCDAVPLYPSYVVLNSSSHSMSRLTFPPYTQIICSCSWMDCVVCGPLLKKQLMPLDGREHHSYFPVDVSLIIRTMPNSSYPGDSGMFIDGTYIPSLVEDQTPSLNMRRAALEPLLHSLLVDGQLDPETRKRLTILEGTVRGLKLCSGATRASAVHGKLVDESDFAVEDIDLMIGEPSLWTLRETLT